MTPVLLTPIGIIKTPFKEKSGVPIQAKVGESIEGYIEIAQEYVDGLADLNEFSHIHIIFHFNQHNSYKLSVTPYMDHVPRGLFSTRAPTRPNPIGLSLVELVSIEKNIIRFKGVDMLDNTPVLDIKPYFADFDSRQNTRSGWLDRVKKRRTISDDRF